MERMLVALILYLFSMDAMRPATVGGTRWSGVYTSSVSCIFTIVRRLHGLFVSDFSVFRKNRDGIVAKIDDDMLRHYCNEDVFLMQVNILTY